jgi:hypothetical protein
VARLVLREGKTPGAEHALPPGNARVRMGRESGDICVPDTGASRDHAEIVRRGDAFFIRDLGSRNGTLLNKQRIQGEARLAFGDRLRIANTVYELVADKSDVAKLPTKRRRVAAGPLPEGGAFDTLRSLPLGTQRVIGVAMVLLLVGSMFAGMLLGRRGAWFGEAEVRETQTEAKHPPAPAVAAEAPTTSPLPAAAAKSPADAQAHVAGEAASSPVATDPAAPAAPAEANTLPGWHVVVAADLAGGLAASMSVSTDAPGGIPEEGEAVDLRRSPAPPPEMAGAGGPGYYGIATDSKRVCFVVDASGSMQGRRLAIAKTELQKAISGLTDEHEFNVIFYSHEPRAWGDELARASEDARERVKTHIFAQTAGGGTNIFDSVMLALKDPAVDTVFLLTDGHAGAGAVMEPGAMRAAILKANARRVVIHCVGLGSHDRELLAGLAGDNGGRYVTPRERTR